MDRDWNVNECLRQRNDNKCYRQLDSDITSDIQTRIRLQVNNMYKATIIDDKPKTFLAELTSNQDFFTSYPKSTNKDIQEGLLFPATITPRNAFHNLWTIFSNLSFTTFLHSWKKLYTFLTNVKNLDAYHVTPYFSSLMFHLFTPTSHTMKVLILVITFLPFVTTPQPLYAQKLFVIP